MKSASYLALGVFAMLAAAAVPSFAQDSMWDFVYNGDKLPQQIIEEGGTDWQPRSGEINGRPKYESIIASPEAQVGGLWSRLDDNSEDPNAPGSSAWARGYLFGTDRYDEWTGKMTLVLRIKDLGTDSQKSVVDITNKSGNYWTLGHVAESDEGPAGWEFGQTNDSRNANGLSDIRTDATGRFVVIRIVIIDTIPGDNHSLIKAWQDGQLVYESSRTDDIPAGEFGEIAFRRTSGGSPQKMEIDWVRMSFQNAWEPGQGPSTPNGPSDFPSWDFTYYGDKLPQEIIDEGGTDWQPRADEVNGRPKYESILFSSEAQVGGIWSRQDDNSEDPDAPGSSAWARGYLFGTDLYDQWTGRMTLVMRIKDMGSNAQKSVMDITNAAGEYWTLGQAPADTGGEAGWNFGQTNDGRNANGLSNVRTGASGKFVVIRIVVIDDVAGDGQSLIKGWQDGKLVYESPRTSDIGPGEFGEIAFRRTSGGSEQHMQIDWVLMKFGEAWEPGSGGNTPAGQLDGAGANVVNFPNPDLVNGAVSLDAFGWMRTVHDPSTGVGINPLFAVDQNNIPTELSMFYLGFDAYRDLEVVANDKDVLTGVMALDKYAAVHPYSVQDPGENVSGPGVPSNPPRIDYFADVSNYNANNPGSPVFLPYFGGYDDSGNFQGLDLDILGINQFRGGDNAIARDIEVAIDWHSTTNAFQGYYLLDAFAGVHYVNNAEVLAFLDRPENRDVLVPKVTNSLGVPIVQEPAGYGKFHDIFGFKPKYVQDYVGANPTFQDKEARAQAPYFYGLPIARDLEVMVSFSGITAPSGEDLITDSQRRNQKAIDEGIDVDALFQPIAMSPERANVSSPKFAPSVAQTTGYAILDGFGGVHTLLEDANENPIPAPWETVETGMIDPSVDAPYFFPVDLAVDLELFPNGAGFALLTRLGEVFVVNAPGSQAEDNFVMPGMEKKLPFFGFDAARNLVLVPDKEGKIAGMYVVDRFGTVHAAGQAPSMPSQILYFVNGYSQDLEISPYARPVTAAQNVTAPQ